MKEPRIRCVSTQGVKQVALLIHLLLSDWTNGISRRYAAVGINSSKTFCSKFSYLMSHTLTSKQQKKVKDKINLQPFFLHFINKNGTEHFHFQEFKVDSVEASGSDYSLKEPKRSFETSFRMVKYNSYRAVSFFFLKRT